jgi:hypothetical protein
MRRNNLQFDAEVDHGLTPATPKADIQAGAAVRF